ncbi:tRNA 2-thiouridine(34) synthase MnmA, partial [Patescibacteria group bacterium]|nr:tRNA 2-thiouridine(34) synthase MnmA [Patescibacteria group bacterium]MBU1613108.1 tRNA 2-thiouridine(34) synthase MnmA [Patescibacteria group bacterium]
QLTINNEQRTRNKIKTKNLLDANCSLLISKDANKDQTYFLHQLNQEQLRHVLFPIGNYTKEEVRKLAKKFKLPTADKEESMGICFVGEVSMKDFLEKKVKAKKGKIISGDGNVVGEHDGLPFYTIGQRIGLVSLRAKRSNPVTDNTRPLFVVEKNIKKNELTVGYEDDLLLYKKEIKVSDMHWISGHPPKFPLKCKVRLRHRQPLQDCIVSLCHCEDLDLVGRRGNLVIKFTTSQRAITPGQFAVLYLKKECLGGGVIF